MAQTTRAPGAPSASGNARTWRANAPAPGCPLRQQAGASLTRGLAHSQADGWRYQVEWEDSNSVHKHYRRRPAHTTHALHYCTLPSTIPGLPASGRKRQVAAWHHLPHAHLPPLVASYSLPSLLLPAHSPACSTLRLPPLPHCSSTTCQPPAPLPATTSPHHLPCSTLLTHPTSCHTLYPS